MSVVTKLTSFLAIVVLIFSGLTACAPPKPSVENADKLANKVVNKVGKKYKLDNMQKEQLFSMYEDFKRNEQLRAEYVALIDGWIREVEKPQMDQGTVLTLMRRKHDLDMKSGPKVAGQLTDLHVTLNEEQKNKVIAKLNEAKAWLSLDVSRAN